MGNTQSFIPPIDDEINSEKDELFLKKDIQKLKYSKSVTIIGDSVEQSTPLIPEESNEQNGSVTLKVSLNDTKQSDEVLKSFDESSKDKKHDLTEKYKPSPRGKYNGKDYGVLTNGTTESQTIHESKMSLDSLTDGESIIKIPNEPVKEENEPNVNEKMEGNEKKRNRDRPVKKNKLKRTKKHKKREDEVKNSKSDEMKIKVERPVPIRFRSYNDLSSLTNSSEDESPMDDGKNGSSKKGEDIPWNDIVKMYERVREIRDLRERISRDFPMEEEVINLITISGDILMRKAQSLSKIDLFSSNQ